MPSVSLGYPPSPDSTDTRSDTEKGIDGNDLPPAELPSAPPNEVDRAVGRLIAGEIESGSCLQIGIGGMPDAVCSLLKESDARDLGVHTEMLTNGIIDLYKAGRITGARKALDTGKSTYRLEATLQHRRNLSGRWQ